MKIKDITNTQKPIEFLKYLGRKGLLVTETSGDVLYGAEEVILLSRDKYVEGEYYDFIFVKYKKGGKYEDTFFLGKWNSGLTE